MRDIEVDVVEIAYHRNGICGEPFYAIRFIDQERPDREMLGIVFPSDDQRLNPRTAVMDIGLLANGYLGGFTNCWRGDRYDFPLREAIAQYEALDREPSRA